MYKRQVKFRRVTIDADGNAWEYDSSENLFACFNFDMRGALQGTEEAMEEEEETDEEEDEDGDEEKDEGEDEDGDEEAEEGAGAAEGGEGKEDKSSSGSTPSVGETWYDR